MKAAFDVDELLAAGFPVEAAVPLASRTTLEVGGPARYLATCRGPEDLVLCLRWARERRLPVFVLGGGSNLLISDRGVDGLVVEFDESGVRFETDGETVLVHASAGVTWDDLVAQTVEEGLTGIECLSGIPGRVGAAPVQNIGAYGQDLSETLVEVEGVDLRDGRQARLSSAECAFGYRRSRFKDLGPDGLAGRFAVTSVCLRLRRGGAGATRYRDLRERFSDRSAPPSGAEVRREVLAIRRSKSMVLDPEDPNRRSAGSFFVNPVVDGGRAEEIWQRTGVAAMPSFPAGPEADVGDRKLSAAWLIEAAGFERGFRSGRVGLSSRHALALINRGGASAREVVELAGKIRRGVRRRFGVTLVPEPVFLGFRRTVDELLG